MSDAFERLYAAHAQQLLWFLEFRTGDRAVAEDLLADTFEKVLRSRKRFDRRKGTEKSWLYAIAINTLRDHARRMAAETRAFQRTMPVGAESDELAHVEHRDLLFAGLAALSDEERDVVTLRYGADLTVPEIAEVTGERLSTVDGRLYRALRKLREMLDERPA